MCPLASLAAQLFGLFKMSVQNQRSLNVAGNVLNGLIALNRPVNLSH